MLVSAAVVPQPPLLIPEVASGAADEMAEVRAACSTAIEALRRSDPDLLVVVGAGEDHRTFQPGARGSLAVYGVDREVALSEELWDKADSSTRTASMPTSLTVAAWILGAARWSRPLVARSVPADLAVLDAMKLGEQLSDSAARVALLAVGDGSAALDKKSPGYVVPGAREWQQHVTAALATADRVGLEHLEPADAERFLAAGRVGWQVMAGAAAEGAWSATLHADAAPYGVAYVVASWVRTGR